MEFKKYDTVVTADDVDLGELLRIHHREEDVNPELRLYASYLEVWSIELGGHIYIPTDYIDEHDAANRIIYITEMLSTVQQETWDRAPSFVAGRQSRKEELPIEGTESIA
ncbi:hypothetical protein [Candidatus Leptofilum sp.]|uniref:hypothetical protein n=1 Tax=Candidatus Leptofilum sp. TaxID=3241576 RepID=UPI003B5A785D